MDRQVGYALDTVYRLIPLVEDAERSFKSARNWSVIDMLGGGFIVDLFKHMSLGNARDKMNEVQFLLEKLQGELNSITIPGDYRMKMNGFLTFGDFFFDGILFDALMASKIFSSLDEIQRLKEKLKIVKNNLEKMRDC